MPLNHEWLSRIKEIEKQYAAVRLATDRLLEAARRDPTILRGMLKHGNIVNASENLDGTYIIRLFAEFETGLRLYWDTIKSSHPRTRDLLDGVAAACRIPDPHRENAHQVREYRNTLVHEREREEEDVTIPIAVARSYLCTYFSFLPPKW